MNLPVFVLSGLFFLMLPYPLFAASGSLSVFPRDLKIVNGAEFRVTVVMDTGGEKSAGTDVIMRFDPNKLELLDIVPAQAYSTYIGKTINNADGQAAISGIIQPGESVSGSHIFAALIFKAEKEGKADISFDVTPGGRNDSNIASLGGIELLEHAEGAEAQIVGIGYGEGSPQTFQKFLGSFKYRIAL